MIQIYDVNMLNVEMHLDILPETYQYNRYSLV